MNYNTTLLMFGLNPDNFKAAISDPYEADGAMTLYLEQRTDINRICPYCNGLDVSIKDYNDVLYNNTINPGLKSEIIIRKVRFKCKKCGKTFTPPIDNIDCHTTIPNNIKQLIIKEFYKNISFSDIAKRYNISVGTTFNIFDEAFPFVSRNEMPRVLCIDEFHFSKMYDQNYCCIIVDLDKRIVVDVAKNRKKEYLDEYFKRIPEEERDKVKYFISDMYDEYLMIKKKYFPNAIHIVDKFHIVLQLTNAINKLRTKVMKQTQKDDPIMYNFMKKNWKLYIQRSSVISNQTYKNKKTGYVYSYDYLFYSSLALNDNLNLAYDVLQILLTKIKYTPNTNLRSKFEFIAHQLISSTDEDIKKVGYTYLKWMDGIVNAYLLRHDETNLTNAIAENTNNHIKTLIKLSYGLNDFERMRKRVLLMSNSKRKG